MEEREAIRLLLDSESNFTISLSDVLYMFRENNDYFVYDDKLAKKINKFGQEYVFDNADEAIDKLFLIENIHKLDLDFEIVA